MDESRAAELVVASPSPSPGSAPLVSPARDLDPQHRNWPRSTANPARSHHTNEGKAQASDDVLPVVPVAVFANSAGAFIPSIVDAPAFDAHHSEPLGISIKQQSEQLGAAESSQSVPDKAVIPQLYDTINTIVTSSSTPSPPPTKFHLPLITAVPQSDSVPHSESVSQADFDWAGGSSRPKEDTMLFGTIRKKYESEMAASRRSNGLAVQGVVTEADADLHHKDRFKQKRAIQLLLDGKIKTDWDWTWPQDNRPPTPTFPTRPGRATDEIYEDWREQEEWASNASDTDEIVEVGSSGEKAVEAFRFENPDTVGSTVTRRAFNRRKCRRRRLHDEMAFNDGVACFTHRRNAWTRARHVHVGARVLAPKPARQTQDLSSNGDSHLEADLNAALGPERDWDEYDDDEDWVTEVPIASPILPPDMPMRKGINERSYKMIYEKVVDNCQTPSCPINLSVMVAACVEGWKRTGEWPSQGPAATTAAVQAAKAAKAASFRNRKSAASLFAAVPEPKEKDKGLVRRSLQKVFGMGGHFRKGSDLSTIINTTTATPLLNGDTKIAGTNEAPADGAVINNATINSSPNDADKEAPS